MNSQRLFGAVILIVGVLLLITGINATHSVADKVSDTFTGRYTDHTTWYIIGGAAAGLLGLVMMLVGVNGGKRIP